PTLLARLSHGPAQALRLPAGRLAVGQAADLVLFDPQGSTLAGESWYSKGQNSPFVGHCLPGRVRYTLVDGHLTHEG
ncbi:amidohydrolase family protein, partial [Pseudomonas aeruginosa]